MTVSSRPLYAALAASVLVTAALATLLAWPGGEIRPMRTKLVELDEPPAGQASDNGSR